MTSATAAYRKDLAAHGSSFGKHDGEWIAVASLIATAVDASRAKHAEDGVEREAWQTAIATATEAVGAAELDRLATREWGAGWSDFDPLTLIAIVMHDAAARALSTVVLDGILRVRRDIQDLAYGRTLAQRARGAYLAGETDAAEDLYRQVDRIGRRLESAELRARAGNGFTGLAQVRGNYPEMLKVATRSLGFAEQTSIPRVRWNARYSMMASVARFRRFDEALEHGWQLFNLAARDVSGEALALTSLGQLLFDMGDVRTAHGAFLAAVSRPMASHLLLPTLGSVARTASLSDHRSTVDWAVNEIMRLRKSHKSPWAWASALLDCVVALRDVGELVRARDILDEALEVARTNQLHALEHQAESIHFDELTPQPERAVVRGTSTDIIRSVEELAPRRPPRHVMVAAGV